MKIVRILLLEWASRTVKLSKIFLRETWHICFKVKKKRPWYNFRYVYFNYREWDRKEGEESDDDSEPDNPLRDVHDRSFCENLKVGVIDLVAMTRLENVTYEGHIGFSSYPAWYICLAASEDYLGR